MKSANTLSLAIAGVGLLLYWRGVSKRYLHAESVVTVDPAA
jgi:MATE family multidrug resistance protein